MKIFQLKHAPDTADTSMHIQQDRKLTHIQTHTQTAGTNQSPGFLQSKSCQVGLSSFVVVGLTLIDVPADVVEVPASETAGGVVFVSG